MKKTETMKINGETFEYCGECAVGYVSSHMYKSAAYDEIDSVYARPSDCKREIWHDWCNWCYAINDGKSLLTDGFCECGLDISSHNCMMFSISGYVKDYHNNLYRLWITRDHNRIYKVVGI